MDSVSEETRERIESDPFCARLGITLLELEPGFARTRLTLRDEHTNFHGTPHGGVVYTLCDAAFAAASNAGEGTRIALETNTSYLAAASVSETLVAVAEETHATRRTAEYQVIVRSEKRGAEGTDGDDADSGDDSGTGDRIATFRGRAYRV
jgi:acyl-CoA thioesterase